MEESIRVAHFLDENGKIIKLPRKHAPRQVLLEYLAGKFEPKVIYTEKQVNEICDQWHTFNDYFILRRELVDNKFLCRTRNGAQYWRTTDSEAAE